MHIYTWEITHTHASKELLDFYQKYERYWHKKERTEAQLEEFFCNGSVYDPEKDEWGINRPAKYDSKGLDEGKPKGNLGPNPGKGYFHILHRIDGKLVALTCCLIL